MCVFFYVCIFVCIHICVYAFLSTHVYVYACIHMYVFVNIYVLYVCIHMYVMICIDVYAFIHSAKCIHMRMNKVSGNKIQCGQQTFEMVGQPTENLKRAKEKISFQSRLE